jgi:pyridoxine kinase
MTRPQDAVLSIQSAVAYGHVGNSAAVLPLQRLGFDVFPVNTVLLAHHPGHGRGWRGHKVTPAQIDEILAGLEERGALPRCAAVLSGYLGDPAVADSVLRAVSHTKAARPDALYLSDPVIGDDHSGVFVAAGIPEAIRDRLLPAADIITPNRFELAHLSGRPVESLDDVLAAAADLRARGPRLVVATGLTLPDQPEEVAVLADSASGTWLVATPRLQGLVHGTGDAFSALFLGHYLATADLRLALERSVAAIFALVERTHASGADELRLVAAQEKLVAPDRHFSAVQLR